MMQRLLTFLTLSSLSVSIPVHELSPLTPVVPAVPVAPSSTIIAPPPSVLCNLEYATTWFTDYKEIETEECHTEYEKVCVTETNVLCVDSTVTKCDTVLETKCHTEHDKVCVDQVKVEVEPYIETVCQTLYSEECDHRWEGEGNDKVWVPIPGTCRQEPYEECADVSKTKERQFSYPVCNDVPRQVCVDVPKEICHEIPEKKCAQKPFEVCKEVPRESCVNVHKRIPIKASKKIPKQKCVHTDGYVEPGSNPVTPSSVPVAVQPQFVSIPANPSLPLSPVPLPQFTGVVRVGKAVADNDDEDNITTTETSVV